MADALLFSPDFMLGFELGVIWQRLEAGERYVATIVRRENEDRVRRMAEARHLTCDFSDAGDGWLLARLSAPAPEDAPRPSLRPSLSVIAGGRA